MGETQGGLTAPESTLRFLGRRQDVGAGRPPQQDEEARYFRRAPERP